MFHPKFQWAMCALALAGAVGCGSFPVHADDRDDDHRVKKVFVIAMENHNWDAAQHSNQPQSDLSESSCAVHQQPGEWYVRHQQSGCLCERVH